MIAKHTRIGFHRIGLVGLVPCLLVATVHAASLVSILLSVGWTERAWEQLAMVPIWGLSGWAFYGTAWVLGWVLAGFAGDK